MYCYRCNGALDLKKDSCSRCGADVRRFKKIVYASNRRYNDALTKANARNLTGAREDLLASLHLYKKNIPARNLLGLVYYALGEPAEAMKQWSISRDISSGSNAAERFINSMQKNMRELNSENNGIQMFNQALLNARNGARDMAIIQLKKVVSVHTNMTKAYNLLALLYIEAGKTDQAEKMLLRCLEVDRGNDTAVRYLKALREAEIQGKTRNAGSVGDEERDSLIIPVRFRDYGSYLSNALYILLGLILGILIAWFVIVPGRVEQRLGKAEAEKLSYEAEISDLQQRLASAEVTTAEAETTSGEEDDPTVKPDDGPIERMPDYPVNTRWVPNQNDVEQGVVDVNAGRYAETVNEIFRVDQSNLSPTNQMHYLNIISLLFSEGVYQRMQAIAYNYFATADYEGAALYYDALSRLHPEGPEFRSKAGQAYEATDDKRTAANRYWQTAVLFPETATGRDAIYRYVMLTGNSDVPQYEGEIPLEYYRQPLSYSDIVSKIGGPDD